MTTLRKIVGIRPNEGKETFLFFLYFFCLIASIIIGKTARDVFFLSRFNPSFLPHIFIISAACVMVTTIFFIRSARNKDMFLFTKITVALFGLSLLLINTFLNKWTYPLLYVWIDIIGAILVPQFWLLANTRFTTRQAKRLFGPIAAASAFANIFIGFSIQYGIILPEFLLPVAAIFLFLSLLIIYVIKNNTPEDGISQTYVSKEKIKSDVSIFTSIKHHKYIGLLCVIVAISSITITLIEYQFKIIASNTYNENQLASFFGMLYGIVGLVSGFMQIFVLSRILRKFGVLIGLLILPVFLGISSLFLSLSPIIIFALMARLSDLILRFSFHDTTMQILWLPVSSKLKQSAKFFVDGTIKNTAQGLTGLLILGAIGLIGSQFINILIIVLIMIWIIFSILLKNGYLDQLKKAVGKRDLHLESFRINIADPYLVDLFKKTLITGNDEQKLFVLNEIKNLSPEPWEKELIEIFHNGSNNIRNKILAIALSDNQIFPDSIIINLVNSFDDPLRSTGIIIAAKRRITQIIPSLEKLLINSDPSLQASANTALIILGKDGVQNARARLDGMLNESNIKFQIAAIKAASNFPELLTHEQLKISIQSDHSELQILGTKIISDRQIEDLLPCIIGNLDNADIFRVSISALYNFNSEKIESIITEKLVEKRNSIDKPTIGLIKAMGEFGSTQSIEFLIHLIDVIKQDVLVDAILLSCKKITSRTGSQIHAKQLEKLLQNRFKYAYEKLNYIYLIQPFGNNTLLLDHLQIKFNEEIKRIFIILDILYPDKMTKTYTHKLQSTDQNVISNIIEIIESQYPDKIKRVLMPLIDETSIEEKLNSGSVFLDSTNQSANKIIVGLATSKELWESTLAFHTIINNNLESLIPKIDLQWSLKNPFIKELISKELNSPDSTIKNTIQPLIQTSEITEDFAMFTTLDKTIILKGVNLFSGLTGQEVFQIAQIATEERYLAKEVIFREGNVGDSMFIIIDGSVSVYNENKEITTLETGECFGEMALLDREPRSSSISAVTDTAVLKIDEESFYELIAGNIEIIQGIVKILSNRLRQSNT